MLEQTQLFARMGDSAEASAVRQRLQARALQSDMAAFKVVRAVCVVMRSLVMTTYLCYCAGGKPRGHAC